MRNIIKITLFAALALSLSSCGAYKRLGSLQDIEDGIDYSMPMQPEAIISKGDRLNIVVTCPQPELAEPFNVMNGVYSVSGAKGVKVAEEASAGLDVSGFEVNEEHPEIIEEGYRQLTKAIKMSRDETDGHCHGIFYWAPESRPGGYNLGAFGSDNRPTKIMQAYVEAAAEAANK